MKSYRYTRRYNPNWYCCVCHRTLGRACSVARHWRAEAEGRRMWRHLCRKVRVPTSNLHTYMFYSAEIPGTLIPQYTDAARPDHSYPACRCTLPFSTTVPRPRPSTCPAAGGSRRSSYRRRGTKPQRGASSPSPTTALRTPTGELPHSPPFSTPRAPPPLQRAHSAQAVNQSVCHTRLFERPGLSLSRPPPR